MGKIIIKENEIPKAIQQKPKGTIRIYPQDISTDECSFCGTEIESGQETYICPACHLRYHKECWTENEGCATYGCTGEINENEPRYDEGDNFDIPPLSIPNAECSLCKRPIDRGQNTTTCNRCHGTYHQECWTRNGCPTLQCKKAKEEENAGCGCIILLIILAILYFLFVEGNL